MKFVPYGEPELDGSAETNGESVTTSCEVTLTCGECGTPLKSASIEGEADIDLGDACEKNPKADDPAHEWAIIDETFDPADRTEGKGRGMRTFYGYTATVKVKCQHEGCNAEKEVEVTADEQASSFDEC